MSRIVERIAEAIAIKQAMLSDVALIESVASVVTSCTASLAAGNKLLFAGNGGSAADAQHLAAEMVGRFELDRAALPAIALTTDTSLLTAVANDFGYQQVFARQVEGLGRKGDVLFGISTSGNSANVLRALGVAREMGMVTVGMTGSGDSEIRRVADHCLCVPSRNTARIQEAHILLGHIICEQVEADLQP